MLQRYEELRTMVDLQEEHWRAFAENGWIEHPAWLSSTNATGLLAVARRHHAKGRFKRAGIGRSVEKRIENDVRRDEIEWLERNQDPAIDELFVKLESLRASLNRELFLGLKTFEAHFARYDVGDFYERHVDRFKTDDSRTISAVVYLNEAWTVEDGGELVIYTKDSEARIAPAMGTLALFRSDSIEHAVAPSNMERWSIAIWFRR